MMALVICIGVVSGIIVGLIPYILDKRKTSVGTLKIDTSDNDGPYLFLELHKDVSEIYNQKKITLDVDPTDFATHQ